MDLIIFGAMLLLFAIIIPALLTTTSLQAYLSVIILVVLAVLSYLWLIEKLAPSESHSRQLASVGLSQVYPRTEGSIPEGKSDGSTRTTVIFVHGLAANPSTTWKCGEICWIDDFLPDDLKRLGLQSCVRLLTFSYKSFWLRKSNLRLRETAKTLLQELERVELLQDDLVLVGHSYGGLVIKKVLAMSHTLKPRLKGVIFLGTPHRGTSFSRYGLLISYLLAPLDSDIGIMRILGPDSVELDDLQKDFDNNYKDMARKYFYEKEKTHRQLWGFITWIQEFEVTEASATWGADEPDTIGLDKDHRGLNRFAKRDNDYALVSRAVLDMLQKTSDAPYKRSEWQDELRNYLRISFEFPREESCTDDEIQPYYWLERLNQYSTWTADTGLHVLWLTGPPGCGKSVLFRQILSRLPEWPAIRQQYVLKFTCNSQHELASKPMNIASAILWQLTEWVPRLVDEARPQLPPGQKQIRPIQNDIKELCNLIDKTLRSLSQYDAVIVAIDALDECTFSFGVDTFLRFLEGLLSSKESRPRGPLKLLLSARHSSFSDIVGRYRLSGAEESVDSSSLVIDIAKENLSAIRLYTKGHLKAWAEKNQEKIKASLRLEREIIRLSCGIFLWTVLVIQGLFQTGSSQDDLEQVLQSLPHDNNLFRLLAQILQKIPKESTQKARAMITFTIMSSRSLSVSELAALLAVQRSQTSREIAQFTSMDIKHDVQTLCRSLLTCTEQGYVQPFHATVLEFFHGESCPEEFRIGRSEGHGIFAETCLKCLQFIGIPSGAEIQPAKPLRYAADNLLYHTMRTSENKQIELAGPIRAFLWSQERFKAWLQFVWNEGEILRNDLVLMQIKSAIRTKEPEPMMPKNVTPMHVIALVTKSDKLFSKFAFHESTESKWFSLHDRDSQDRTVVHWAAGQERDITDQDRRGGTEDEIISSLLRNGLSVNARAKNGRSPLHIASQRGRLENLTVLLKHSADVNATDEASFTPLHLSVTFSESVEAVRKLIDGGSSVDALSEDQWTPLHIAVVSGHTEAINTLVAAQATVDAREKNQMTPLHFAALDNQVEAMNALIAAQATVDAVNKDQLTPLHIATLRGHTEAINALIAAQATIDITNKDQQTPLYIAVMSGHTEAINTLVAAQATVDAREKNQMTPLHFAALTNQVKAINALIAAQATVDAREKNQMTPLHFAALNNQVEAMNALIAAQATVDAVNKDQLTPLYIATLRGHTEAINALIAAQATIDITNKDQQTPLYIAVMSGHTEAINTLVAAQATVDARENNQMTPLHFAALTNQVKAINALIAAQATVDAREKNQMTPLHFAALNNQVEAMNALIAAQATVDAVNEYQLTPLHLAAFRGHTEAINTLVAAHASIDAAGEDQLTPLIIAALNSHTDAINDFAAVV